jgi:hypothetical protein
MTRALVNGPQYIPWEVALNEFRDGDRSQAAISRHLILQWRANEVCNVIYRGEEAGTVRDGEFFPALDRAPITKLVVHKLLEEGIVNA